jgi:membrane-associated protein
MLDHLLPLLSSPWLYVIVVLAVAVDGFVPVVPSETLVIGLGALSATGRPDLAALAAAVVAGGMAGDRVSYALGRRAGRRPPRDTKIRLARRKAEEALARHGGSAVLAGRFLPYGRTTTALMAGAAGLPMGRFVLFSGLASVAWAGYAIGLGRLGGAAFAGSPLLGTAFGTGLGLLLAAAYGLAGKLRGRRLRPAGNLRGRPRALETVGADRVMYASGHPFTTERAGSARRFLRDAAPSCPARVAGPPDQRREPAEPPGAARMSLPA